jgi:tol-pal system protein YbgF
VTRSSIEGLALIALFALGAGCAGPAARLREDNSRLTADLDRARAELRREQRRTRDLETDNLVLRDRLETRERAAGRGQPPRLPVEVLGPDDGPGATPPAGDRERAWDDDLGEGARLVATTEDGTEIVYVGEAAQGRGARLAGDLDLDDADDLEYAPDDDPRRTAPPPRRPARRAAPRPDPAAVEYQAAIARVRSKDHAGALAALRAFLAAHPRHDLADNAQYWLGEVYYDQRDWARALVEFRTTVESYPRGNKVPDALLKMGYCFVALGQTARARAALELVIESYPRTPPAELAAKKLAELRS